MMPRSWSPSARAPSISRPRRSGRDAKLVANWVITELFGALNRAGRDIGHSPVTPGRLGELVDLIGTARSPAGSPRTFLPTMLESGEAPAAIVEKRA